MTTPELTTIKNIVDKVFQIDISDKTRKRNYVDGRTLYYKFAAKITGNTKSFIGASVGRDHCAVVNSFKNLDHLLLNDRLFLSRHNQIQNALVKVFSGKITATKEQDYEAKINELKNRHEKEIKQLNRLINKENKLIDGINSMDDDLQFEFYNTRFLPFAKINKVSLD